MRSVVLALGPLLLGGCAQRDVGNDSTLYPTGNDSATLSPGIEPVRIGESGSSFPACNGRGQVRNLSSSMPSLPLRTSPFDEAGAVAQLPQDAPVFLCTRSLDQSWQGVVVPPAGNPAADCGVTGRIDTPRDYAGPCRSGWVLGAYVVPLAD